MTRVLFSLLWLIQLLRAAQRCSIDQNVLDQEKQFADITCTSENTQEIEPLSVCLVSCKSNPFRFKHYCGSDGKWDQEIGKHSCGNITFCHHPKKSWQDWNWECPPTLVKNRKCVGTCSIDSNVKVEITCQSNGEWHLPNEVNLEEMCKPCPKGPMGGWRRIGHRCYLFVKPSFTYIRASFHCNVWNGKLFEPKDLVTNSKVFRKWQDEMDSDDIFWIGINDIAKEGEYVYDSNLQPVIFENWFFDHPENYSKIQDCVAVAKRLGEPFWDDKECETKLPFICQELD